MGFHHIAVEHALLVEQGRPVERKLGAQWSPRKAQYRDP
jgi:hypothetical protein